MPWTSHSFSPTPLKHPPLFCCWAHFNSVKELHPSTICILQTSDHFQPPLNPLLLFKETATPDPYMMKAVGCAMTQPKPILMQLFPCVVASLQSYHCSSFTQRAMSETLEEKWIMTWVTFHTSQCTTMGFEALVSALQSSQVNNFINQLAIQCRPDLAFILQPSTSHLCYVCNGFPSPGHSSGARAHKKPHANKQPAWQTVSWKERIGPETTGLEERNGLSAPWLSQLRTMCPLGFTLWTWTYKSGVLPECPREKAVFWARWILKTKKSHTTDCKKMDSEASPLGSSST